MRPYYATPRADMHSAAVDQLMQAFAPASTQTLPNGAVQSLSRLGAARMARAPQTVRPEIQPFPRGFQQFQPSPVTMPVEPRPQPRAYSAPARPVGSNFRSEINRLRGEGNLRGLANGFASRTSGFPSGMTRRMRPGGMAGGVGGGAG